MKLEDMIHKDKMYNELETKRTKRENLMQVCIIEYTLEEDINVQNKWTWNRFEWKVYVMSKKALMVSHKTKK